jgi:CRISPR/Cas system-associated protein Csx1
LQSEALKMELETNLRTNLKRRKQDLEAVISSVDADSMVVDAELKRQELSDAKILVNDASDKLKSENFSRCCLLSIHLSSNRCSLFDQVFFLRYF